MTDSGSTIGNTLQTPEAFINDGLRTLDNVLPHLQREDTTVDTPDTLAQARTAEGDQADGLTIREDEHVVGALERVRSFVKNKRRLAGVVGTMGVAVLAPAVSAQAQTEGRPGAQKENAATVRTTEGLELGDIEGATTSYPYLGAKSGGDPWGYGKGGCESYVAWAATQNGTSSNRVSNLTDAIDWLKTAKQRGEIIDQNPAAGAIAISTIGGNGKGHAAIVESVVEVNGEKIITMSDMGREAGFSRWRVTHNELMEAERATNGVAKTYFVHFELPAPAKSGESSPLTEAQRIKVNKIDAKTSLESNTYIQSKNKRYSVLLDKFGNLAAYDKKSDYNKVWESGTKGKGGTSVEVKQSKKSNSLVITNSRNKRVKAWNIGKATKVAIGNDGTLAGYKGSKRVWIADELGAVSRAAKQSMSKIASVRQKALGR